MATSNIDDIPVQELVKEPEVHTEEVVETEVTEEPEVKEEEGEVKEEPKTPAWLQRRIDREVREKHELRRQLEAERSKPKAVTDENLEEVIDKRATEKALQVAAQVQFDNKCNTVFDKAASEFKGFEANFNRMVENFGKLPQDMVETIIELDNAPKVLAHIAADPEETSRLLELSPTKRAIELTKLEDKLNRPIKPISKAPPPVTPVAGGKATPTGLADSLSDEEWIERRNRQEQERFAARRR